MKMIKKIKTSITELGFQFKNKKTIMIKKNILKKEIWFQIFKY